MKTNDRREIRKQSISLWSQSDWWVWESMVGKICGKESLLVWNERWRCDGWWEW